MPGYKKLKLAEIQKDKKLMGAFLQFAKDEHALENVTFYFDKGNMAGVHPKYIRVGAPKQINISSGVRSNLQKHYDNNDESAWDEELEKAKDEIFGFLSRLVTSFHFTEPYIRMMLADGTAKAAKVLGIDKKHHEKLIDCLVLFHTGKVPAGKKKLGEFLKKAKIQIEVDIVLENLKKQGLI
jgi:hypothetical protein